MNSKFPKTKEEAFHMLDAVLKKDGVQLNTFDEIENFRLDTHFGLGLWIRNSWLYGKHASDIANLFMTTHLPTWPADIVSSEIIEQYATYLKENLRSK